jgi:hypothetical protein
MLALTNRMTNSGPFLPLQNMYLNFFSLSVATDLNTSGADVPARRETNALAIWLEQANQIQYRLGKLIGLPEISAPEFMDKLCIDFLANRDKDLIQEHVDKAGKLQKKIRKYQNEVLTLAGIGPDFNRVDAIVKEVCMLVGWVEELLCLAMVDAAEFTQMYETRSFCFQKV